MRYNIDNKRGGNKMKKVTKILTVVLLIAMIVLSVSEVFATGGLIENIETATKAEQAHVNMGSLPNTVGKVIAYIRNASILVGVVILIILGVKYMIGSVEEKAGYQKSFVPLVVGIIVVMAATSIASFLFSIFE